MLVTCYHEGSEEVDGSAEGDVGPQCRDDDVGHASPGETGGREETQCHVPP